MGFTLSVAVIGSALFALCVAGVYAVSGGLAAFLATWALKVLIGAANILIGKAKMRHEHRQEHAARFEPVADAA